MAKITKVVCDRCNKETEEAALYKVLLTVRRANTPEGQDSDFSAEMEICEDCSEQVIKVGKQRITLQEKMRRKAATPKTA